MSKDITVVLVHGFWGGAAHWQSVVADLKEKGFNKIKAIEIPLTSLKDDASLVADIVSSIEGKVLLVGHSYGGVVITEAGNLENVVGLLYVAAFAPDKGESAGGLSEQTPSQGLIDGVIAPDEKGRLWIKEDKYAEYFCADVEEKLAYFMAISQKAPYAATFGDTITDPAWKYKKVFYQLSTEDKMINPQLQKMMSERMEAEKVFELKASHAPLASKPKEISNIIEEVVENL